MLNAGIKNETVEGGNRELGLSTVADPHGIAVPSIYYASHFDLQ